MKPVMDREYERDAKEWPSLIFWAMNNEMLLLTSQESFQMIIFYSLIIDEIIFVENVKKDVVWTKIQVLLVQLIAKQTNIGQSTDFAIIVKGYTYSIPYTVYGYFYSKEQINIR